MTAGVFGILIEGAAAGVTAAVAATPEAAVAPTATVTPVTGAGYGGLLLSSVLMLVVVAVLAAVVVLMARRWGLAGRPAGRELLDVVARMPLEPRRSLYVVEVAGKALLVGTSEMGLTVLSELDRDVVRASVTPQVTFAEMVRRAVAGRGSRSAASASVLPVVAPAVIAAPDVAARDHREAP